MLPALHDLIAHNGGLVSREEALLSGLSDDELRRALRAGRLVVVRRGVYTTSDHWEALDPHRGVPLLRALAASRAMTLPHVLSHDSAAHLLGLSFFTPVDPLVHVTRPRVLGSRTHYGVKHHGAAFDEVEVTLVGRVRALGPARTAVDLAREHGHWIGTSACDAALRMGVRHSELRQAYGRMENWPGVRAARGAVADADPGADNPAESYARLVVAGLGFGVPETQFPVRLSTTTAWCDLRLGTHVFELDGRQKYFRAAEGGIATADAGEVVWAERNREREICDQGLGMSRILFRDLLPQHREQTRRRLSAEVLGTFRRLGPVLPEQLARFAAQMAGERQRRILRPGAIVA